MHSDENAIPISIYADWLDIPADRCPPDRYALPGLARTESDADVIKAAALSRSEAVRRQSLKQPELATVLAIGMTSSFMESRRGVAGKDVPRENVRPVTFVGPINDPSPDIRPNPFSDQIDNQSSHPTPILEPLPVRDPEPTPESSRPLLLPGQGPSDPLPVPTDTFADPILEQVPIVDSPPKLSAKQMIDFEWSIKEIKVHLAERDVYTAIALIGRANEIAQTGKPGAHTEKLERLELLAHYVDQFWGAVFDGLPGLEGIDLLVGSTVVHIEQVSQNTIAYRVLGRNFKRQRYEWPSGLVRAIAENWLEKKPKSKILVGAFMAVDKRYGPEKAREQWEQALAGDAETVEAVQKVMPVLNEL